MKVPCRILGRHLIAIGLVAGIAGGMNALAGIPSETNSESTGSFGEITRFSTDVRPNNGALQPRVVIDMQKVIRRAKRVESGGVFALDIRNFRLSYENISSNYRQRLVDAFGDRARSKYESKVAVKMRSVIRQLGQRVPEVKLGVIGLPMVPFDSATSDFNEHYTALISEVDVFMPRLDGASASSEGMEYLMALAGERPIIPASYQPSSATESAASGSGDPSTTYEPMTEAEIRALLDAFTNQEAITMLQAAWGTSDATWDFNGDGSVGGHDFAILLAYIGNDQQGSDDSDGSNNESDESSDDGDPDIDPDSGSDSDDQESDQNDAGSENDSEGNESDDSSGNDGAGSGSDDSNDDHSDDSGNDSEVIDDSGIGVLVSGPGFSGTTFSEMRVGNPTSPGYGAKAIARWTEFPFINRTEDFYVTISAFHMTGIDRVEFFLNGGDPLVTEEIQPHPETGYGEYIAKVDVSELAIGKHEIRAIIYPNHGLPRVLQGEHDNSNIHMMYNGNQSFWFNHEPEPRTVRVGPSSEFATIDQALNTMGSQIIAGRIELEAGDYTWITQTHSNLNNTADDKVLEICAAPGVSRDEITIRAHPNAGQGPRNLSIHVRGVTLLSEIQPNAGATNGYILRGSGSTYTRLFLEDILCTPTSDYPSGWASGNLPGVTKVLTNWRGGCWVKHMDFVNIPEGIKTVFLAKHTSAVRTSRDIWGQSPGAVIDCRLDKRDAYNAEHQDHPDIIHFHVHGDFIENRIFADVTSTNDHTQVGHLEWSTKLSNFAFVRWNIDSRYPSQSLNFNPDFDHLVMVDCVFRGASVDFKNQVKHVLLKNLVTYKFRGDAASDVFDESTLITENVHFCQPRDESPTWATYGPLNWAAASAPTGESSSGTGGFIPTLVQNPSQITNWTMGNRNVENRNNSDLHHFYYDPALLDLTWWR